MGAFIREGRLIQTLKRKGGVSYTGKRSLFERGRLLDVNGMPGNAGFNL